MTDPRLAPLAAALKAAFTEKPYEYADGHVAPVLRDDAAAAILAALPPDWCGHSPEWVEMANGALDIAAQQATEIARLRAIEEAARAHAAISHTPGMETDTLVALRAALGSER